MGDAFHHSRDIGYIPPSLEFVIEDVYSRANSLGPPDLHPDEQKSFEDYSTEELIKYHKQACAAIGAYKIVKSISENRHVKEETLGVGRIRSVGELAANSIRRLNKKKSEVEKILQERYDV